jgi:hypothetical protein
MSTHPTVRFHLSAAQDKRTLRAFEKDAIYDQGRNLEWAVFKKYPTLKSEYNELGRLTHEQPMLRFINETYRSQRPQMERTMLEHRKRWERIAPSYFKLIEKLFDHRTWPRGKYIAYGTIWGVYPRFLENKTFQIPFRHKVPQYVPVVIAHELLHFLFYDYFYERFPKLSRQKDASFVWHVSEIFNTLVQNSPEWMSCFKRKSLGYPEHDKIVANMSRKLYRQSSWNLNDVVDEIIKQTQKKIRKNSVVRF